MGRWAWRRVNIDHYLTPGARVLVRPWRARADGPAAAKKKSGRDHPAPRFSDCLVERPGRRRRPRVAPERGTSARTKPPIFRMVQRTGEFVISWHRRE